MTFKPQNGWNDGVLQGCKFRQGSQSNKQPSWCKWATAISLRPGWVAFSAAFSCFSTWKLPKHHIAYMGVRAVIKRSHTSHTVSYYTRRLKPFVLTQICTHKMRYQRSESWDIGILHHLLVFGNMGLFKKMVDQQLGLHLSIFLFCALEVLGNKGETPALDNRSGSRELFKKTYWHSHW